MTPAFRQPNASERHLAMAHAINPCFNTEQPGLVSLLVQSFALHREYVATYRELTKLSDDQLTDIGISRPNIGAIARAAVYAS